MNEGCIDHALWADMNLRQTDLKIYEDSVDISIQKYLVEFYYVSIPLSNRIYFIPIPIQ